VKNSQEKNGKWIVDVLLVVVIIAMGILIYYRVTQWLEDRRADSDDITPEFSGESTSEPAENMGEEVLEQPGANQEGQEITAQPALDFNLESLTGENISLSDFVGTPVMVNFWATWCPPCRAEMPLIQEYAEANQGDFVVLAVNVGEEKSTIENFVTNQNFDDLIFLLDPTNSVVNLYRISGFPTSLFIDSEGMLQGTYIGEMSRDLLIQYLAKIGVK